MFVTKKYKIIDISQEDIEQFEQMGTKTKFWYVAEDTSYLFKSILTEDKQGNPIVRYGEDWAEKIACELAAILGIPHAQYELAKNNDERGIRTVNFIEQGEQLTFGNQLIEHIAGFETVEKGFQLKDKIRLQTVSRVYTALDWLADAPPKGWSNPELTNVVDVFIGYLMFDVLISNQDRHNENWGIIVSNSSNYLAPSYDHAASLGRNESDKKRLEILNNSSSSLTIHKYVRRSKSFFYSQGKRIKTLDAFEQMSMLAIEKKKSKAPIYWLGLLEHLTEDIISSVITKIPDELMSEITKEFTLQLILANRDNLLELKNKFYD